MQKSSFLFLLILAAVALLGAYQAAIPQPLASSAIVRFLALSAFFLVCVSLIIGPLAVLQPQKFAQLRRAPGALSGSRHSFLPGLLHVLLVLSLYFNWSFGDVLSLTPLVIAIPAYVVLLALALTSSDFAVNRLGMAKWRMLHAFIYPAFILVFAHFLLQATGLYAKPGLPAYLNLAEAALLLLGIATIILQIAGFLTIRTRKAAAAANAQQAASDKMV